MDRFIATLTPNRTSLQSRLKSNMDRFIVGGVSVMYGGHEFKIQYG